MDVALKRDRLPLLARSGYGVAELGMSAAELLLQFYLLEFYVTYVGLRAHWAGLALALGIAWDAISDPAMGAIADRTRSRYGRFLPYVFFGSFGLAFSLILLFNPPLLASQPARFSYLLATYLLVNTAMTVTGVPHISMGGAIAGDRHERTEIYGWRLVFGTLGFFAGILLPALVADLANLDVSALTGLGASRAITAWWIGIIVIISALVTCVTTSRWCGRPRKRIPFSLSSFLTEFHAIARNRIFLPLLIAFILSGMGRAINASMALPYYKIRLNLPENAVQKEILGLFAVCIVLSVPFWVILSRHFGKKWPAFGGILTLGIMTSVCYPFFPSGEMKGPLVAAVIGGISVGAIILFESLVADIVDLDEQQSGENREGAYFGIWKMGMKIARAGGIMLSGILLGAIGYKEGIVEQTPEVGHLLAWVFGPGVGAFFVIGAIFFARMPLSEAGDLARMDKRETGNNRE